MQFIENQGSAQLASTPASAPAQHRIRRSGATPGISRSVPGDLVPMTNMRKLIAKHMIESRRTSAHVHCMYEVDFTRIVNLRASSKTDLSSATVPV